MKKFLSILAALLIVSIVSAQSTSPRWGSGPPTNDNTGRVLTYSYGRTLITSSATAVLYQKPNAFVTILKIDSLRHALTDSLSITNAYVGDQVEFVFAADSLVAGRVVTFGNHIKSAGTLTVTKNKKATACFIFDGVAWVEIRRAIMTN